MARFLALKIVLGLLINIAHESCWAGGTSTVEGVERQGRFLQPSQNNDDVNGNISDDVYGNENGTGYSDPTPPSAAPTASAHAHGSTTQLSLSSEPNSSMVVLVELLGFVVLVNNSTFQDLASNFVELLTGRLTKEFDSLVSVDLQLETQTISGRTLQSELVFSGFATFNATVSDQLVLDAETRALQDTEAVRQIVPDLISISISNPAPVASPPAPTNNLGLIIIVVVGVVAALLVIIFFGYRYFRLGPKPSHSTSPHTKGEGDQHQPTSRWRKRNQDPVLAQEMAPPENFLRTHSSNVNDAYSLDGISTSAADLEAGVDMTEVYLIQRFQENRQRAAMPSGPVDTDQTFDDTDTGFSFDLVGTKGLEYDDDVMCSTGAGAVVEVGADGKAGSATVYDFETMPAYDEPSLGRPFDESTLGDDALSWKVQTKGQQEKDEIVEDDARCVRKEASACEELGVWEPEPLATATSVEV